MAGEAPGKARQGRRPAVARRVSRGSEEQPFVETARAIALEIDRHVAIANRLQLADDEGAQLGLKRARQFRPSELDACEIVVVPYAAHAEPETAEHFFGALDGAELFVSDFRVIR